MDEASFAEKWTHHEIAGARGGIGVAEALGSCMATTETLIAAVGA